MIRDDPYVLPLPVYHPSHSTGVPMAPSSGVFISMLNQNRFVAQLIEDIHALRTNVDLKQKKIRNYNPDIFEEIRQRET